VLSRYRLVIAEEAVFYHGFMLAWSPTPYPDVNAILAELLANIRHILGSHLIGFYLDGSLAHGDFDEASDIDFVAVTDEQVTSRQFEALYEMHTEMNAGQSKWAMQLEGSYVWAQALRRYDPTHPPQPNIERGLGERLKWEPQGPWWLPHLAIVREKGIALLGPPPHLLIDPVSADDLRQVMRGVLDEWGVRLLGLPSLMNTRGYQSYVVLTLCRILYTLQHGNIASKKVAARWAQTELDEAWVGLIERAWADRQHPEGAPAPDNVLLTLKLIKHTIVTANPSKGSSALSLHSLRSE
jgi:hypothetical protein